MKRCTRSVFTAAAAATTKSFRDIPGYPRLPIWGNLYLFKLGFYNVEKYHEVLQHLHAKYGSIVREDLAFGKTIIHVFDPEDAHRVYMMEGRAPHVAPLQETTQLYRQKKNMSPGLGNINGDEWYRLRHAVRQMMLRPQEVSQYLPAANEVTHDFISRLHDRVNVHDKQINNLMDEVAKWSQEASGYKCFQRRLGCMDGGELEERGEKLIHANREVFKISSKIKFSLPLHKLIETPKWKKLVANEDLVNSTAVQLVRETLENIKQLSEAGKLKEGDYNFLTYLLAKPELSIKDVEVLTLSLLTDNLTTTVPSLIYNLYCLAKNPEVQDALYKEVSAAVPKDGDVSGEALNHKLPLLKAILKETFRFYPVGTEISRILQSDHVLSGYHIPQGTHVHLNQFVHNMSDKYFKDPLRYYPERWMRDSIEEIHPYLLVPFGHGTRTCAGRRFAEQDLYVAIAKIVQNFELKYPEDKPPLQQVFWTLLLPEEPIHLQFVPRR